MTRKNVSILLLVVATALVGPQLVYAGQDLSTPIPPAQEAMGCKPHFLDLTDEALQNSLATASLNPIGEAKVSFTSKGSKISSQVFEYYDEEGNLKQVETRCMATCTGNGCGVSGCDVSGASCTGCSCPGCSSECSCTKFSQEVE